MTETPDDDGPCAIRRSATEHAVAGGYAVGLVTAYTREQVTVRELWPDGTGWRLMTHRSVWPWDVVVAMPSDRAAALRALERVRRARAAFDPEIVVARTKLGALLDEQQKAGDAVLEWAHER